MNVHQIGSGMYVSGPAAPGKKRPDRQLSPGSTSTPPYTGGDVLRSGELGRMFGVTAPQASSSRRSSGPLHAAASPSPAASGALSSSSQLPRTGLLVGPSPCPAQAAAAERGGMRPACIGGVPLACYVLLALGVAAAVGAGAFFFVSWRRWVALATAGGAVAAVAALFAWNAWRSAAEAEAAERVERNVPVHMV